jgi:DNA-binding HxlR family transcriptional regulator
MANHLESRDAMWTGDCVWAASYAFRFIPTHRRCTVRSNTDPEVVALRAGKWKLEILWLLNQRMHRFGELRRAVPGIAQHMLTAKLRQLEADGLVKRPIYPEVPLRVEYEITPKSRRLKLVFDAILT